jgi:hypothetical protein
MPHCYGDIGGQRLQVSNNIIIQPRYIHWMHTSNVSLDFTVGLTVDVQQQPPELSFALLKAQHNTQKQVAGSNSATIKL